MPEIKSLIPLLTVVLALMAVSDASTADSSSIVSLDLSNQYRIDTTDLAQRDMTRPFFFNLIAPTSTDPGRPAFPFTVDRETNFKVWLDDHVPPRHIIQGGKSLAMRITSDADEDVKDKIMFAPVPHNSTIQMAVMGRDNQRYLSFDFMLDSTYENPTYWLIHLQAWQCCAGNPPFTIQVTPSQNKMGPVEFAFGIRDDRLKPKKGRPQDIFYKMNVPRGEWHHITLELKPEPDGALEQGLIALWYDGVKTITYTGPWSYDPAQKTFEGHDVTNDLGIDLGIYRRRQRTTQEIYFDNIYFGLDLRSVESDQR